MWNQKKKKLNYEISSSVYYSCAFYLQYTVFMQKPEDDAYWDRNMYFNNMKNKLVLCLARTLSYVGRQEFTDLKISKQKTVPVLGF